MSIYAQGGDGRNGHPTRHRRLTVQRLEPRSLMDGTGLTPTNLFVSAGFQEILVRQVDQVALTFFSSSLQNGAITRLAFTETLTHSIEYFSSVITSDYNQFLGRAPDAAGLAFWEGLMQQGMSDEQLESQFIGSPEFFNHCGGTNQGWVNGMYADLLGRLPDAAGDVSWVSALNAGMPRSLAAFGFAGSAEREAIVVRDDYNRFLGREASEAETDGWVNRFRSGMSNENIIAGFVASDEFFNALEAQSSLAAGTSAPVTINIGTININIGSININSGNINSGNINSGNDGNSGGDDNHHRSHGDD